MNHRSIPMNMMCPDPEGKARPVATGLKRDLEFEAMRRNLYVRIEVAVKANHLDRKHGFCLGMLVEYLQDAGPDSEMARILVDLVTGKLK